MVLQLLSWQVLCSKTQGRRYIRIRKKACGLFLVINIAALLPALYLALKLGGITFSFVASSLFVVDCMSAINNNFLV